MKNTKKVVSINSKRLFGAYLQAFENEYVPDDVASVTRLAGALLGLQILYSVYGGIYPLIAFAGSDLTGILLGALAYRYWPADFLSLNLAVPQTQAKARRIDIDKAA